MTDLPINVSSAPAKVAATPTGNNDSTQKGDQEFGNVLARQVAKPTTASNSTIAAPSEGSSKPAGKNDKEIAQASADAENPLPGTMLASLMVKPEQNPMLETATTSPAANIIAKTGKPGDAKKSPAEELAAVSLLAGDVASDKPIQKNELKFTSDKNPSKAGTTVSDATNATGLMEINNRAVRGAPAGKLTAADLIAGEAASGKSLQDAEATFSLAGKNLKDKKSIADTLTKAGIMEMSSQPVRGHAGNDLAATALHSAALTASAIAPSIQTSSMLTTNSPMHINTPLTQATWGDDFSQQITWMANQRNQSAELHLNPPQLGPLDVVLKMNGDQATAMFTSPHAAVRDAIEQALPRLREMLADSGIMLGNAMVSDQSAQKNQDNSSRKSQGRTASTENDSEISGITESKISTMRRPQGMVDTFA